MPRSAASVGLLQSDLAASAHRDLPSHLRSFDNSLRQRPAERTWQQLQHTEGFQRRDGADGPGFCCRDQPEAGVSFLLLGQNELRCRLSRSESEGAEGGLRVANPLKVLPEDLHHLRAHLLVKSHLDQLVGWEGRGGGFGG